MAWAQCPLWQFSVVACRGRLLSLGRWIFVVSSGKVAFMLSDTVGQCAAVCSHFYASSATGTKTTASVLKQRLPNWLSPPATGASNLRI